jgi:hypothetical protein
MRFFASGFFHESVSPQPQSIPLGPFQIFSKIPVAIRHRCQFTTGVVETGGKFAAGIVDTGGKFATVINNTSETGGKICRRCHWYQLQICRRCRWYRRQFCRQCHWHRCRWYRWCTLTYEYLRDTGGNLLPVANNANNIRLHTPSSELECKNLYIC